MRTASQAMLVFVFVLAACRIAIAASADGEPPPPPALRRIPGLTAPDQFPRGCVDCHVNRPDLKMDVRLSTLMQRWQAQVAPEVLARVRAFSPPGMPVKGIHPRIKGDLAHLRIPEACLKCHTQRSRSAPPFGQLLHGLHLVGGEKNHFLLMFQGECTHCHKLDAATGSWSLGSGTENQ